MLVGVRPCARLLGQLQSPPRFMQRLNLRSQSPLCVSVWCAARGSGLGCGESWR